jgi:hypothetical protein
MEQIAASSACHYTCTPNYLAGQMTLHPTRFLAFLLVCSLPVSALGGQWQYSGVERIVAVSDIHGAYQPLVATLRNAAVLDRDLAWSGGSTHLVIVGDILDRGPDSRDVMDLLMRLEGEAEAAGGMVHVLIGNHEAMNLIGDLRYVAKEEFAAFADEETEEERTRWLASFAKQKGADLDESQLLRQEFDERFPAGFFAHRREFEADGTYGAWLLSQPVLVVINGTAFVHGGLSPMIADIGLDGVNGKLAGELARYVENLGSLFDAGVLTPMDNFYAHPRILQNYMPPVEADRAMVDAVEETRKLAESDVHAADGPLWYRGNVACCRLVEEERLQSALDAIGAERVVIGHTPTQGRRILERFDGDVIEVDTGMLRERYGGSGNALIIEGDRLSVVNEESMEVTPPQPHPRQVGSRPGGFLSAEATEALLASGEISNEREDAAGRTIVTVSDGNRSVDAVFVKRENRETYPDLAAYRLDRLLELDMVPVTVIRELGRREGSLQFLPPKLTNEQDRSEAGRGGSANCPLPQQWSAMYVFDVLIHNEGRTPERITYRSDDWQLILVGHERAFGRDNNRPRHLENVDLDIGDGWRSALNGLTDDVIEREFAGILDKRRRTALAARRDALLGD